MSIWPTLGSVAGSAAGTAVGGPVGAIVGGSLGASTVKTLDKWFGRSERGGQRLTADGRRYEMRGGAMLSSLQVQSMYIIEDTLRRTRLPYPFNTAAARYGLGIAMVVNAYAESNLDPSAVGDNGASIGLFQANMTAGAGKGHDIERLKDAAYNTRVILGELVADGQPLADALMRGTTGVELTRLFCIYIERPANASKRADERAGHAMRIFGDLATRTVRVP